LFVTWGGMRVREEPTGKEGQRTQKGDSNTKKGMKTSLTVHSTHTNPGKRRHQTATG